MKIQKITFRDVQLTLGLVLLGLVFIAGLLVLNWWAAKSYGKGEDLLSAWNGARAFLFENIDPYTRTVAERTQVLYYGRVVREGEFPFALDIPFPLMVPLLPLGFISDFAWARAVWMTLSELGLMLLSVFALRLADWRPSRWFTILLLVFSLTWFFSVTSILNGSFSAILVLALVGALLAMRDFNDELAGFLLALSAMKWEITLLLWMLIIIGAYSSRRWRVFAGMGMTWIVVGAIGFLLYPDWIWAYMRAVAANWRAADVLSLRIIFEQWIPGYGASLALLVAGLLLLILILEWFVALRGRDFRRVAWVAALAIAITPLVGPSNTYANLVPLVFPIAFMLPFVWERWAKYPYVVITLLISLFYFLPLILQLPSLATQIPADGLTFLLPPVLTLICLYWIRWTLVRPPRTWLDGVKRELKKQ